MHPRSCAIVLIGKPSLLREGLRHILGASGSSFQIVASAATVDDLAWASMDQNQPLLLIIDASGEARALPRQIATFKTRQPCGRVVVLTDQYVAASVLAAFHAGANACYHKAVASELFVKALELVALGETILPPELLSHIQNVDAAPDASQPRPERDAQRLPLDFDPKLSSREEYILKYIGQGYPNKIIAARTGIAEGTVKVHVKAILRKIRVGNRTQAAVWLKDNPISASTRGLAQLGARPPACAANGASKSASTFTHPSPQ
jgi:two-component system nitrate/nitrite response regulator NarL